MRVLGLVLLLALLFIPSATASAAAPPTCFGLPATQILDRPGTLNFTSGNDVFIGSHGRDRFVYGETAQFGGVDYVCAGGGHDYIETFDQITVDGGRGNDTVIGGEQTTVYGGPGNDTLVGDLSSELWGGDGNDTINGRGAQVYGEAGNDDLSGTNRSQVFGGPGKDKIFAGFFSVGRGEEGNDRLEVGSSSTILGGEGNDRLENVDRGHFMDCGPGRDRVMVGNPPPIEVTNCETTLRNRT